jgi:hypothetical protein
MLICCGEEPKNYENFHLASAFSSFCHYFLSVSPIGYVLDSHSGYGATSFQLERPKSNVDISLCFIVLQMAVCDFPLAQLFINISFSSHKCSGDMF